MNNLDGTRLDPCVRNSSRQEVKNTKQAAKLPRVPPNPPPPPLWLWLLREFAHDLRDLFRYGFTQHDT